MKREFEIRRVSRVEACCRPLDWAWPKQNRAFVEENWKRRKAGTALMFNGRVLLLQDVAFEGDVCRNTYFEVDYADFVAWIDAGYPDPTIANGFAMGALRGSDGAYICGVMVAGTANAGRVYFPAGTPDLSDLKPDGTVDLATSLTRELAEETGLSEGDYRVADEWIIVQRWSTRELSHGRTTTYAPALLGAVRQYRPLDVFDCSCRVDGLSQIQRWFQPTLLVGSCLQG